MISIRDFVKLGKQVERARKAGDLDAIDAINNRPDLRAVNAMFLVHDDKVWVGAIKHGHLIEGLKNWYGRLPLWGSAVRKSDGQRVNWYESKHGLLPALVVEGGLAPLDASVQWNEHDFYALVKPEDADHVQPS